MKWLVKDPKSGSIQGLVTSEEREMKARIIPFSHNEVEELLSTFKSQVLSRGGKGAWLGWHAIFDDKSYQGVGIALVVKFALLLLQKSSRLCIVPIT
ncbi:hypothetical protein TNCT_377741 [Trichonephila clavata]|uniref:Uncharacterized protein n=1 Tax=Trichonephila clavata TaxID=2740835 RepID=A0A8X6KLY8_TRICU|nr:hypothetical protein TNCT_377741 [Trichonephila clavata]